MEVVDYKVTQERTALPDQATAGKYRYLILVMGALVQFCCGIAYVWSVFQPYAKKTYALDLSQANLPFGILLGLFAVGNLLGGYLQKKWNATLIILAGGIIMCLGLFLTAFVPVKLPWMLNVTYGCIAGFGCGITYNTVLATLQSWFPDKRGMVTGIIICASGSFGLVMNPIANSLLKTYGFRPAMIFVATTLFIIIVCGGFFIKRPHPDYMIGYKPQKVVVTNKQYTIKEMLKTKQYYIIATTFALAVPAYFLMNPMLMSLGMERGLSSQVALIGVMLVSGMNTVGRLLMPWISDWVGRKPILLFLFIFTMITIVLLTFATGYGFLILVSCIALSYGGFMGMYPTINADYFGSQNAGMNYGVVMLGYAISSIGCPYLVRLVLKSSMGITLSFVIAGIASVTGFMLILTLKKP